MIFVCKHHNTETNENKTKLPQILKKALCVCVCVSSTAQLFVRTKAVCIYLCMRENKPIDSKDNCDSNLRGGLLSGPSVVRKLRITPVSNLLIKCFN